MELPGGQISDVGARDRQYWLHVAPPGVSDVAEGHHAIHGGATTARVRGIVAERLLSQTRSFTKGTKRDIPSHSYAIGPVSPV